MTAVEDRLAEIEARAGAATEGPWAAITSGSQGGDHWYVCDADESIALIHANDGSDEAQREPDAAFIAAARTDVPALTEALQAVLALADELDTPPGPSVYTCDVAVVRREVAHQVASRIRDAAAALGVTP